MNTYLLSIVGLLTVFIVGVLVYGVAGKSFIGDSNAVKLTPTRFLVAGAGMFVIAYSFISLYSNVTLGDSTGVMKGLQLALMIAVPFTVVPIFADAPYFKSSKMGIEWVVIINWLVSILALGVVVGLLA